jgi:outer membrane autotransporter protein
VQLALSILVPFSVIVPGGNAGAVAAAFDQLNPNNPDVQFLTNFLNSASADQLQCDFDQMQPALFNAIPIALESAMTSVRKTLSDRMEEIHKGKCTVEPQNTLAMPDSFSPRQIHDYMQESKQATPDKKTGLWLTALGNFTRQQSRSQNGQCDQTKIGFQADNYGSALGIDRSLSDHVAVGGAVSYTHTHLSWKKSQGHSHANSLYASLFSTFFNRKWYLDLAVTGAFDWTRATRDIYLVNETSKLKRHARHNNHAEEFNVHVGSGLLLTAGHCWEFRPFFTIDYIYVHEDDYREKGAKSIDLQVNSKNSNLLRDEIGASWSYKRERESFAWSPELKLSYVRESRFNGKHTHAQFVDSSAGFEVSGFLPDRNLISPGANFTLFWPKRHFSLAMRYNGEFSEHWYNQMGSAEFLWRF